LPDEALLEVIRNAVRWHWDEPLPPEEVASDLQLAGMLLGDQRRVPPRYGGIKSHTLCEEITHLG
jgi:hypothetical protein